MSVQPCFSSGLLRDWPYSRGHWRCRHLITRHVIPIYAGRMYFFFANISMCPRTGSPLCSWRINSTVRYHDCFPVFPLHCAINRLSPQPPATPLALELQDGNKLGYGVFAATASSPTTCPFLRSPCNRLTPRVWNTTHNSSEKHPRLLALRKIGQS